MALALPRFRMDRFCSVIPIISASCFDCILRRASITSRFTMMGITSNRELVFFLQLLRLFHDHGNDQDDPRDDQEFQMITGKADREHSLTWRVIDTQRNGQDGFRENIAKHRPDRKFAQSFVLIDILMLEIDILTIKREERSQAQQGEDQNQGGRNGTDKSQKPRVKRERALHRIGTKLGLQFCRQIVKAEPKNRRDQWQRIESDGKQVTKEPTHSLYSFLISLHDNSFRC